MIPSRPGPAARLHVVLVEPEIPQNTGNVARTCAAVGAVLHLVHPLGFEISERAVRRAGLDYWHLLEIHEHESLEAFLDAHRADELYLFSARGDRLHTSVTYDQCEGVVTGGAPASARPPRSCYLVFGRETRGLPESLLRAYPGRVLRIPVRSEARSLNLSNAVAVAVYEVQRQWGYTGLSEIRHDSDR